MERIPVKSSNLHSVGHDESGAEIQFHAKGCSAVKESGSCDCGGGNVYHYPTMTASEHAALMAAPSPGEHFMRNIRPHHQGVRR